MLPIDQSFADMRAQSAIQPLNAFMAKTDNLLGGRVMLIRSPGFDGSFSADSYSVGPFLATDYDQDIVWADGNFLRWPVGVSSR